LFTKVKKQFEDKEAEKEVLSTMADKRKTLSLKVISKHENAYEKREAQLTSIDKVKNLKKNLPSKPQRFKTNYFPKIVGSTDSTELNCSFSLAEDLVPKTPFHEEMLARLGLISREFPEEYTKSGTNYFSGENGHWLGLEYFSMIRSGKDVVTEYRSYDELKRMR
jgi:hypothetical protein